jgi:hypothetical protein
VTLIFVINGAVLPKFTNLVTITSSLLVIFFVVNDIPVWSCRV